MVTHDDRRFGVRRVSRGEVDVAYVRTDSRGGVPLLVIPGGPGLGSVLPYRWLRRMAAKRGFDVVMVEHRGVGFSRRDRAGNDLTWEDLTVLEAPQDLVAVPDACEAYAQRPDGRPLDPALGYSTIAGRFPSFAGEPIDASAALRDFTWPVAVVSGARDLRSVRPLPERIRDLAPQGVLVPFDGLAHSILDNHPGAAVAVCGYVARGDIHLLPARTGRLAALSGLGRASVGATMLHLTLAGGSRE
ncbi:alpha/beta fold hydrolase [Sinosporangium siamense]|uniref:Alpha/beta hydrolase n=1 Tax=Sinosporangium siamense TaxID=1367973 RepID=A0A919RKI7_9ACTN|nr:hypothetical protein [Sinosporangium siamense]GII95512.1 hypothetical protein Ssi02_57430 [Sinosporangium siamense]